MDMNQRYPSMRDFAKALVVKMGAVECIRQPLYDHVLYPTAGVAQLPFFQFPFGQGLSASPGNANNTKALTDTNLEGGNAGMLPAPQAYWVESIELDFQPGSVATANTFTPQVPGNTVAAATAAVQAGAHDVNAFYSSGALNFTVGAKSYYQEGPLYRFPSRSSLRLYCSVASNSATAVECVKEKMNNDGEVVKLDPGIGIMTSMNFQVSLNWPAVVATPSGFNGRAGVYLSGWLYRPVQ